SRLGILRLGCHRQNWSVVLFLEAKPVTDLAHGPVRTREPAHFHHHTGACPKRLKRAKVETNRGVVGPELHHGRAFIGWRNEIRVHHGDGADDRSHHGRDHFPLADEDHGKLAKIYLIIGDVGVIVQSDLTFTHSLSLPLGGLSGQLAKKPPTFRPRSQTSRLLTLRGEAVPAP